MNDYQMIVSFTNCRNKIRMDGYIDKRMNRLRKRLNSDEWTNGWTD